MVVPAVPVLVLVVMVCALVAALVARARSISHSSTRPPSHTLSRRRIVRWGSGSVGLSAAVVASLVLGQRAIFLIGPLALSGYVAGLLLGDLMMPHAARGPVRHVSLDRRTISRYVNPTWIWGWRTGVGAASVAIVAAGIVGAADGRSLTLVCANDTRAIAGPWPGWSFGEPALVALLIAATLVEVSMRRIVGRPRPDPAVLDPVSDEAMRTTSIRRAVSAGMAIALIPLTGVALSAASILSFICSPNGTLAWTSSLALGLAIAGIATGIGSIFGLAWLFRYGEDSATAPGPRVGRGGLQQWN